MFRSTFKKRKKTVTRLRADNNSDDDGDNNDTSHEDVSKRTNNNDAVQKSTVSRENKDTSISKTFSKFQKKNKKKKGIIVQSFGVVGDEVEDPEDGPTANDNHLNSKKRKRKRGGLGFGGAPTLQPMNADEDPEDHDIPKELSSFSTYGKEALEQLKQEQKYKAAAVVDKSDDNHDQQEPFGKSDSRYHDNHNHQIDNHDNDTNMDDYIPLKINNGASSNMILTGDEALQFEEQNIPGNKQHALKKEDHFDTVTKEANLFDDAEDQQQAEETSAWEAEITRRAGIPGPKIIKTTSSSSSSTAAPMHNWKGDGSSNATNGSAVVSLVKLKSQIQTTISQLETQQDDVHRACQRRRTELTQTEEELRRQELELNQSGQALEKYQQWREQFTFWTGAIRDLQAKVQPIQEALIDLDVDTASCSQWRDWEDDMCAVLYQHGLLDRVLGRQPPDFVFEKTVTVVDEFGRDVKSQQAMNREKRTRQRLEIQRRRNMQSHSHDRDDDDQSDFFVDAEDIEAYRQRRNALSKALDVALEELEDEYTQLPGLVAVFKDWQKSYPEDYNQCFANLSLGDLATVLVQVELCKNHTSAHNNSKGWLDGLIVTNRDENQALFQWVEQLKRTDQQKKPASSLASEEAVNRVVEKCFVPLMTSILDKSAYNLLSKKQSRSLSFLFAQLSQLNSTSKSPVAGFAALKSRIAVYIRSSLENVAIAILNSVDTDNLVANNDDEDEASRYKSAELKDAIKGATNGQLRRLSQMLMNAMTYWAHELQAGKGDDDIVEFLLDFLSSKYLYLLSSLRGRSESTSDAFSELWGVLQETKWLDQPGRILQAAPLRAAAIAFSIK